MKHENQRSIVIDRGEGDMKRARVHQFAILALLVAVWAVPAWADGFSVELLAGRYSSGEEVMSNQAFLGARGGFEISEAIGIEAAVSLAQDTESLGALGNLDLSLTLADLSVKWHPLARRKHDFFVYGGPGWAFADVDGFVNGSADTLTAHVGLGVNVQISDRLYLRPDIKVRWFEDGGDVSTDTTIGIGYKIGRRGPRSSS